MANCKANLYKSNNPQIIFFLVVDKPTMPKKKYANIQNGQKINDTTIGK